MLADALYVLTQCGASRTKRRQRDRQRERERERDRQTERPVVALSLSLSLSVCLSLSLSLSDSNTFKTIHRLKYIVEQKRTEDAWILQFSVLKYDMNFIDTIVHYIFKILLK